MTLPDVHLPMRLIDATPAGAVEVEADPATIERLFTRVRRAWRAFGESEPDWSVSTHDQYRRERIGDHLEEFRMTGERDAARFSHWMARNLLSLPPEPLCLDFGCGTGRVTHALAARFHKVIAVDASPPHLNLARRRVAGNVDWRLIESYAGMLRLPRVDAVYSLIVLQHSPPPLMLRLIKVLLALLKPGGVAYFQCPVFRVGYSFRLQEYLASPPADGAMEMHFLPQRHIFDAARELGCRLVEVLPDPYTGDQDAISCTFLLQRSARLDVDPVDSN